MSKTCTRCDLIANHLLELFEFREPAADLAVPEQGDGVAAVRNDAVWRRLAGRFAAFPSPAVLFFPPTLSVEPDTEASSRLWCIARYELDALDTCRRGVLAGATVTATATAPGAAGALPIAFCLWWLVLKCEEKLRLHPRGAVQPSAAVAELAVGWGVSAGPDLALRLSVFPSPPPSPSPTYLNDDAGRKALATETPRSKWRRKRPPVERIFDAVGGWHRRWCWGGRPTAARRWAIPSLAVSVGGHAQSKA